jgi:hypothetical protein
VQNDSRTTLRVFIPKIKELRKSGHSASQRKPWVAAALGLLAEPRMRWLRVAMILGSSMLVDCCCVAAQQPQAAAPAPVARTSKAAESLLNADRALAAESHAIGFVAAYAKAMAPDARKLDGGEQPVIGRDSILALMARYPAGSPSTGHRKKLWSQKAGSLDSPGDVTLPVSTTATASSSFNTENTWTSGNVKAMAPGVGSPT